MKPLPSVPSLATLLSGSGEMAARLREFDWDPSFVGSPAGWDPVWTSTLALVTASPVPMALYWGLDGHLVYNDAWRPLLGSLHPSGLGRPLRDLRLGSVLTAADLHAVRVNGAAHTVTRAIPSLGRQLKLSLAPVRQPNGSVAGVLALAEETPAVIPGEAPLRALDAPPPGLVWHRPNDGGGGGTLADVNETWWEAFTGQTLEERTARQGIGWLDPVHPEDRLELLAAWRQMDQTPGSVALDFRLLRRDGAWRWVRLRGQATPDGKGTVTEWAGTMTDITGQKDAEDLYRTLFESMDEGFCTIEVLFDDARQPVDYRFLETNPAFARQTGVMQAVGRRMREIAPMHEREWFEIFGRVAVTGETVRFEHQAASLGRFYDVCAFRVGSPDLHRVGIIFNDVTDRRRNELALRTAHDLFRHLVENSPFGVYAVDADFRLVQVSTGARRVFQNVNPLLGRDFAEVMRLLWPDPFASEAIGHFRTTLRTGEPYRAASMVERRADTGDTEAYDWKIERVTLPDGRPGVVCHFYDLSERQKYESALRATEGQIRDQLAELDALYGSAPVGLALVDCELRFVRINEQLAAINGVSVASTLGRTVREVLPWMADKIEPAYRQVIATGETLTFEIEGQMPAAPDIVRNFLVIDYPIKRVDGTVGGVGCVVWEITERKQAEAALRESEARFRTIADSTPVLMWLTEEENYLFANRAHAEFVGVNDASALLGDGWTDYVHPEDRPRYLAELRAAFAGRRRFGAEVRFRRHDGAYRWMQSIGVGRLGASQEFLGFSGCTYEIDAHKRAAETLERRVAERTGELREKLGELEAFSYSVSHDMRGPLRSMHGFSQALLEDYAGQLDETGRDYLHRIMSGAQRLDLLIRDVLAYSKVSKGDFAIDPIELVSLVRDVIQSFNFDRGTIEIIEPLPRVLGHAALLTQIFSNLLSNATKFQRPEVPIAIRVRAERQGPHVRLWVEDNGIGIAPEHFGRIFQIFGRVHADRTYEGTGIGLAIVKKAAERLGGTVGVESEPGRGSRFWLELRAAD